jgi:glyoxylase I family protein
MERVTGIGGVFFRAKDPDALSEWYERHFGITPTPTSYGAPVWMQEQGPTVFAPMADSEFFRAGAQLFINFRVDDLDAMVRQLEAAGIKVRVDAEQYPNGRFASLEDPEGNQIQLWQPATPDVERGSEHD